MKKALFALGALAFLVAAGTYLAGEQTEVVVLRTFDPSGVVHETKLWAVDREGAVWVRLANRGRGWYGSLLRREPVSGRVAGLATLACVAGSLACAGLGLVAGAREET